MTETAYDLICRLDARRHAEHAHGYIHDDAGHPDPEIRRIAMAESEGRCRGIAAAAQKTGAA